MNTHTPLPWACVYGTDGHHHIFAQDGPIAIVSVQADADRQNANANLILAAPELLDALKNFIDCAVTDSDHCAICRFDWPSHASGCAVAVALHAIAKAVARE